jgi:hypothetical protein
MKHLINSISRFWRNDLKIFLSHLRNVHRWKESEAALITMSKSFEAIKTNCPSVCLSVLVFATKKCLRKEGCGCLYIQITHLYNYATGRIRNLDLLKITFCWCHIFVESSCQNVSGVKILVFGLKEVFQDWPFCVT